MNDPKPPIRTGIRAIATTAVAACSLALWWLAARGGELEHNIAGLAATGLFLTVLAFRLKRIDRKTWIGLTIIGILIILAAL